MDTPKAEKVKQSWQPGSKVKIGGRDYVVEGREETAPKGLARAWIIASEQGDRRYKWRPFRGLELISGQELVRPRRRRKAKTVASSHTRQKAPPVRGWRKALALFGFGRKASATRQNQALQDAPGEDIEEGVSTGASGK